MCYGILRFSGILKKTIEQYSICICTYKNIFRISAFRRPRKTGYIDPFLFQYRLLVSKSNTFSFVTIKDRTLCFSATKSRMFWYFAAKTNRESLRFRKISRFTDSLGFCCKNRETNDFLIEINETWSQVQIQIALFNLLCRCKIEYVLSVSNF